MSQASLQEPTLLLIDTCGETSGVAIFKGQLASHAADFVQGSASSQIVAAVRELLQQTSMRLNDLHAISVVNGPGSFTGVRTGMAVAKGLCEAASLPMVSVSRLEVLAEVAKLHDGYAVLDAGRGELYVRDVLSGEEWLSDVDRLQAKSGSGQIAVAEARVAERLTGSNVMHRPLHVGDSIRVALQHLGSGETDIALADVNYVRTESNIYRKPNVSSMKTEAAAR